MTADRSARAELIDLDAVRRRCHAQKAHRALDAVDGAKLDRNEGFTSRLAESVTLHEGLKIALDVVSAFSVPGALFRAFSDRQKRKAGSGRVEFHEELRRRKNMVGGYSSDQLKALLALYQKNSSALDEIYIVPAAEEFLYRFQPQAEET